MEAVRRDRRCVDEPSYVRCGERSLEHVSRAGQVDASALGPAAEDDVGKMHDDAGVGHERVDGVAIDDVALAVLRLDPAPATGIERPPGHAEDAVDSRVGFERVDGSDADLAGWPGDGDRESH